MSYIIKRGRRARLGIARAHLGKYDAYGNITSTWCGFWGDRLMSSNAPWGLKTCKHCLREANR